MIFEAKIIRNNPLYNLPVKTRVALKAKNKN